MRELHVVALSEDGASVVLATSPDATTGTFQVARDERLAAALRGDLAPPTEQERDRALSVREIQARLRGGESPGQIARSAGVSVARVERFAGPVLSERARVLDDARSARLLRDGRGSSALPLGEAVDQHLAQVVSLREDSVEWSARREPEGRWVVEVTWAARTRSRSGRWHWDPATRRLDAADEGSAALGYSAPRESLGRARGSAAPAAGRAPAQEDDRVSEAEPRPEPVATGAAAGNGSDARRPAAARALRPASAARTPEAVARAALGGRRGLGPASVGTAPAASRRVDGPPAAHAVAADAPGRPAEQAVAPERMPAAVRKVRRPVPADRPDEGGLTSASSALRPAVPAPAAGPLGADTGGHRDETSAAAARDRTGQEKAAVPAASERTASQRTASEPAAPGSTAPEHAALEHAALEHAVPESAASESTAPEDRPSEHVPSDGPEPSPEPGPPVLRVVPPSAPARRSSGPRDGGRRPSVPPWADVLLSTAPRDQEEPRG